MFIVRKLLVRKHERALLFENGDFVRFLLPGAHYELDPLKRVSIELFNVAVPLFEHRLADFFVKEYAEDVARLFTVIETGADEVATVYENGRFAGVIAPFAIFFEVTAPFRSCFVPTLPAGRLNAA